MKGLMRLLYISYSIVLIHGSHEQKLILKPNVCLSINVSLKCRSTNLFVRLNGRYQEDNASILYRKLNWNLSLNMQDGWCITFTIANSVIPKGGPFFLLQAVLNIRLVFVLISSWDLLIAWCKGLGSNFEQAQLAHRSHWKCFPKNSFGNG